MFSEEFERISTAFSKRDKEKPYVPVYGRPRDTLFISDGCLLTEQEMRGNMHFIIENHLANDIEKETTMEKLHWIARAIDEGVFATERHSWHQIRNIVWERDKGVCQVCFDDLTSTGKFHAGHIVDRMCGGPDSIDNVVVMCRRCNMCKDTHDTKEEFEDWLPGFREMVVYERNMHFRTALGFLLCAEDKGIEYAKTLVQDLINTQRTRVFLEPETF